MAALALVEVQFWHCLAPFLNLTDPAVFSQCFSLQVDLIVSIFIPLWYMIIKLTHVLSSAATNCISAVNICYVFRQYCLSLSLSHTHTNLILSFKYSVFAASRWPVLPKHVGRVPGNNTICCGCRHYVWQILGAFAQLRKAAVSFVVCVRSSAWNISATTGRIFMKFIIWVFFENTSRKWSFIKIRQE